jgi:hypothetical protein
MASNMFVHGLIDISCNYMQLYLMWFAHGGSGMRALDIGAKKPGSNSEALWQSFTVT